VNLPAVRSLPSSQIALLRALANEFAYQNATTISIMKYTGALEAGAQYYAKLQLQAIQNYASQRDQAMSQFANLLSTLPPLPSFNSTSVQAFRNSLRISGLPVIERQVLSGLGLSSSIPDVAAGLTLFNETSLNKFIKHLCSYDNRIVSYWRCKVQSN
jgi:hypothetical protein